MTARDNLLAQLRAITADGRADLIPDLIGDDFPTKPDRSRMEVFSESKVYERLAKCAAEMESLFEKVDSEWLEIFFDVTGDRRRWLKKLPRWFELAATQEGRFADSIPKGGTGGQRQMIFLRGIGEWCVTAFEKLSGERAQRNGMLDDIFETACAFADVSYGPKESDGGDYWPIRRALEARDKLTTEAPDAA
jgi:hypothetical protein